MILSETDGIFGLPMSMIKTYSTRYRVAVSLSMLLDMIVVIFATALMFQSDNMHVQIWLCVIMALVVNIVVGSVTKSEYKEAFDFYRKNKNCKVEVRSYSVTANNLFSVLFCTGYKRVKPDCSVDTYKELFNSACIQNKAYAKRIMKYLSRYEAEDGDFCVVVCNGKYVNMKGDFENGSDGNDVAKSE